MGADDTRPNAPHKKRRRCPTPRKNCYRTRDDALRAALGLAKNAALARPYFCPCGRWHLTTWTLDKYNQRPQ